MFLSFFYSFFFVTGAGQFVAAALNLSQGIPAGFFSSFSFFFLSLDLGPDAKSNTDLNSAPPPLLILHSTQTALWFLPRGWYRALLRNGAHLTPSDNPAHVGLP